MRNIYRACASAVAFIAIAGGLFVLTTTSTLSQRARIASAERRAADMDRKREQYEREHPNGDPETAHAKRTDTKQVRETYARVKQDFEGLQVAYNQIVRAMSPGKELDHRLIKETSLEINRRALRLKRDLALPSIDDGEKHSSKANASAAERETFKADVLTLCRHIAGFVTNPMFESSGSLDADLSARASADLKKIIELSDSLKTNAEKLARSQN